MDTLHEECERLHSDTSLEDKRRGENLSVSVSTEILPLQQSYVFGIIQDSPDCVLQSKNSMKPLSFIRTNHRLGDDAMTVSLSAIYAKLIVVLGLALPVSEILSDRVPIYYYQGFYLYLYLGSILFITFMYATLLKNRAVYSIMKSQGSERCYTYQPRRNSNIPVIRYGSFYLRLGAIAFGMGSMVYSGLEFGEYFEIQEDAKCYVNFLQALTPACRLLLTMIQMQFIFLNSKAIKMDEYKVISRFGLMHMIATNLCEWLHVLVQETRHEIAHLDHLNSQHDDHNSSSSHHDTCKRSTIMGSLVQNASPFMFPCTIEYSLICAVILYEMWKNMKRSKSKNSVSDVDETGDRSRNFYIGGAFGSVKPKSHLHLSVDCAHAHKGLFAGILLMVLTILSLILYFVLSHEKQYAATAVYEVNVCELVMYIVCSVAVGWCMFLVRELKYKRSSKHGESSGLCLDNTLLVMAQIGTYIYCMFSIIGCYFMDPSHLGLFTELCSLIQTTAQTLFILDAWWRRCCTPQQHRKKPGRQIITFLLVANMAIWAINALEKSHAGFRASHLDFYGKWAWTVITHISMPLAIFYRFHSTICLFEIWKTVYKAKHIT